MPVVQVSSRQFRDNQALMFDLADKGDDIFIQRGAKKAYILKRIVYNDFVLSPEMEKRIEQSRQEYLDGKAIVCKTADEALKHMDTL